LFLLIIIVNNSNEKEKTSQVLENLNLSKPEVPYENLIIENENNAFSGIYDPSIEYLNESIGYMAYSAVKMPKYVSTGIAKTIDNGKTWQFISSINTGKEDTIDDNGKEIKGVWRNEVPTLVYDKDDTGKEWKLYTHKYFTREPFGGNDRVFSHGWITYQYASNPEGVWSEEIPLFGAKLFPPEEYPTKIKINDLHSDLKDILVYSELGSLYYNNTLYLSIAGHEIDMKFKLILLQSKDHGETWQYSGTFLTEKDAENLGHKWFTGSSLVEVNDNIYLITTGALDTKMETYSGTHIFLVEDLSKAKLKRDNNNNIEAQIIIPLSFSHHGGQSDYDKYNYNGGVLIPELDIDLDTITYDELVNKPNYFTIRRSEVKIE
ncbi:MAG: exo-alpha-sialidase, partial [Nanoarchaeota archaeon]|nr:exo-alpha-sialidase [Nanoarchaeota archaeon]